MSATSEQLLCQSCGSAVKDNATFCVECGSQILISKSETKSKSEVNKIVFSEKDQYIGYVQIIAVIEIALGFFTAFIGFILILFGSTITPDMFLELGTDPISSGFYEFIAILLIFIGLILIIFGALSVYFGYKLYQFKQMGRIGTMVISALNLFNIPFGTIFGIFSLILLTKPEVIKLFNQK